MYKNIFSGKIISFQFSIVKTCLIPHVRECLVDFIYDSSKRHHNQNEKKKRIRKIYEKWCGLF